MGRPVCGGEDHLLESALHRVVIKRGATGSRPARARQPMWPPGGGGARQPFPSGAPAAPPLGTCDVRAFHGCYTVARGGAPVREAARAPTQAGRGSTAQRQHQHQHQTRAPRSPARRLPLAREPALSSFRALPKYGAAVLRGHPARAPGRARPAALGGPACPAELAPPGGALRAPRLLLPVCAEGDQAAHAEDAGLLDAGGTAGTGHPSPAVPASSPPDIPGPPCWDILVSTTIGKMLRWPRPPGLAFHAAPWPAASVVPLPFSLPQPRL